MTIRERVACPDCSFEQKLPEIADHEVARCRRCRRLLQVPDGQSRAALALTLGALLLWIPGCLAPLLTVIAGGASRSANLVQCTAKLWGAGYPPLSILVVVLMLVIPSAFMLFTLAQALPGSNSGELRRVAHHLRPWLMTEVFVVGGCVAYSRIQTVAFVEVDVGGWCLAGAALLLLGSLALRGDPPADEDLRAHLTPQRPATAHRSLEATTALVIAGLVLYIPANVLPVLQIERYGGIETDTILGGVIELVRNDLWPLAVIVFMASVVVPLAKLFGLAWLLWQTRRGSAQQLRQRTRVYRLIDTIGRWSNIDVFMISILGALVQFGALERVRPEPGALAFAGVVLITMFAAQCFDPRAMWRAATAKPDAPT
ncbi:MAG: paraquat-inducible protein A [Steroidobacteraceae bacterium]